MEKLHSEQVEKLVGKNVEHSIYGKGLIVSVEGNYVRVRFKIAEKLFLYPDSFYKYLKYADCVDRESFWGRSDLSGTENIGLENYISGIMERFDQYKLTSHSKDEMVRYFRYVARGLIKGEQLAYNFYVHTDDEHMGKEFVNMFFEVRKELKHALKNSSGHGNKGTSSGNAFCSPWDESNNTEGLDYSDGKISWITEYDIINAKTDKLLKDTVMICISGFLDLDEYLVKEEDRVRYDQNWESFKRYCESTPYICKVMCVPEKVTAERISLDAHLYNRMMQHHIHFRDYSARECTESVLNIFKGKGFVLGGSFADRMTDYVECVYQNPELTGAAFVRDLADRVLCSYYGSTRTDRVLMESDVPAYREDTSKASIDDLVGLKEIKEKIKCFESSMRFYKQSIDLGMNLDDFNLHMLFMGNPGTGKTTVASLIADILYRIGLIKKNAVVVAERKDLVARYVGQTPGKTNEVIKRAMGGVLFVDEAYSLVNGLPHDDYGYEAIATIITAMEKYKDNLVVIFAGYEKEMEEFINSNPGIRSRLGYTFKFNDLTADELHEIYEKNMHRQGFTCDDGSVTMLRLIWGKFAGGKNFGNGRFVHNVSQEIIMRHAERIDKLEAPTEEEFKTISAEDIPTEEFFNYIAEGRGEKIIGF